MRRLFCGLLLVGLVAGALAAQAQAPEPAFDVASVKPVAAGATGTATWKFGPSRFEASQQSLRGLIRIAYDAQEYQVVSGPGWVDADRFDVSGTYPPGTPEPVARRMIQGLLATRFQLQLESELRTGSVFDLTVEKGSAKLEHFVDNTKLPPFPNVTMPAGAMPFMEVHFLSYTDSGAKLTMLGVRARQATMAQFAQWLGGVVGRPVRDQTDLAGSYNFAFKYAAEGDPADANAASIYATLQEALGLKLIAGKGPVPTWVIRAATRPSAN